MDKKQKNREYQHNWYIKNKKKKDIQSKEWAKKHRKEMVKIVQKYVQKNKEKVALYNKDFGKSIEGKYRLVKHRHKERKWLGDCIGIEEFEKIVSSPCTYCGDNINNGIDRVENDKGYTKENSVSCCRFCNFMKKNWTKEFFIEHVKKIYNHNL